MNLYPAFKENMYNIWDLLKDRYAKNNLNTKVQLQSRLNKIFYIATQNIYVNYFSVDTIENPFDAMDFLITELLSVAIILASFLKIIIHSSFI